MSCIYVRRDIRNFTFAIYLTLYEFVPHVCCYVCEPKSDVMLAMLNVVPHVVVPETKS